MNYKQIYDSLIKNAISKKRLRTDSIRYENHHILPVCIGGNNDVSNLVLLTPKEHFIVHHLLSKLHKDNRLLTFAFWAMCNQRVNGRTYRVTSITYSVAKENFAKLQSDRMLGENNPQFGRKQTLEEKKIASDRMKFIRLNKKWGLSDEEKLIRSTRMTGEGNPNYGKERSSEHINNWKESRMNGAGWIVSPEQKKLQSINMTGEGNPMFGKKQSEETKAIMREKALMRPKLTCPHCGKIASKTNSLRWHFEKCHLNPTTK